MAIIRLTSAVSRQPIQLNTQEIRKVIAGSEHAIILKHNGERIKVTENQHDVAKTIHIAREFNYELTDDIG